MKAFKVSYDLPASSGNRDVVLAESEDLALIELERKSPYFKNIGGYYKVHSIVEVSLEQVKVKDLSVAELLRLFK